MRTLTLKNGTELNNLTITYKNLFNFQRTYDSAKDLMEALIKKQSFDHEVMVQMIYVGYLGTNPEPKLDYLDFLDQIGFDYKRDMLLFNDLVGAKTEEKN